MTLKETLNQIELWDRLTQIEFCKQISKKIPIGIRSIWSDETTTSEEKLEGIKWLNEFNHKIDNFIFTLEKTPLFEKIDIFEIGRYAQDYAKHNNITKGEISAIIKSAYNFIENNYIQDKTYKEDLHELINSEGFRKRISMYIGEPTISNLQSFICGYNYAVIIHKIVLTELDLYFEKFNEWVMKYFKWKESTAGWKNIILKEMQNDETKALQTFFILYDKFLIEREL